MIKVSAPLTPKGKKSIKKVWKHTFLYFSFAAILWLFSNFKTKNLMNSEKYVWLEWSLIVLGFVVVIDCILLLHSVKLKDFGLKTEKNVSYFNLFYPYLFKGSTNKMWRIWFKKNWFLFITLFIYIFLIFFSRSYYLSKISLQGYYHNLLSLSQGYMVSILGIFLIYATHQRWSFIVDSPHYIVVKKSGREKYWRRYYYINGFLILIIGIIIALSGNTLYIW